ncbi:MAG: hypothetical protein DRJ15_10075 [Bacteroidetes bacterium]|nr:MAG: hypothetical protein DRJ15_10075 [Bacteroidota bacterium]
MKDEVIAPYIPIYHRSPNKFIGYHEEDFDDGCGHRAIVVVANFKDKKGNDKEMVAYVRWIL